MSALEVAGLTKSFGGVHAVRGVTFAVAAGRDAGADRPERRRQDHLLQHAERPDPPGCGAGPAARPRHRRPGAAPGLAARRRPHLPDHRDLRLHDGAGERADGAAVASPPARRLLAAGRRGWMRAEAEALLARVGMAEQADRPCGVLAYGDLKRVELAIALASEPALLLMDEPTAGMAPRERIELMALTAAHRARTRHRRAVHRARHGRGLRPCRPHPGARPRRADRRGRPRRGARRSAGAGGLSRLRRRRRAAH